MKKGILFSILIVVSLFAITGCFEKKDNYDEYIGYQFSGNDPWGNELAITIRSLKDDKLTWTYTDTFEDATAYQEITSKFKDGKTSFNIKDSIQVDGLKDIGGQTVDISSSYSYDYSGTLTLKDGKLFVKYEKGSLTTVSSEGDSASYQVGPLDDKDKTVTLKKVVDNS